MSTAPEPAPDRVIPRRADAELTGGAGAARDSLKGGAWTLVSRVTGVVRVVVIGMTLGPTYFGNAYQLTNTLPNLLFYGFLAGSMFSSLLVPLLVRHVDAAAAEDRAGASRLAGGFLGTSMAAMLVAAPVAVLVVPLLIAASLAGSEHAESTVATARLLMALVIPQVFCYAVVGTCTALMNAHRRFALAAGGASLENLGTIVVLLVTGAVFGTVSHDGATPVAEVLLLGLGSTAAVALNAAVQWWGVRRLGERLRPRRGWRDPQVRALVRRALPALVQAALLGSQTLMLLLVSNRVPGGTVATQIALNFYYLPIAIVATPVALAVLPRLSRLLAPEHFRDFGQVWNQGMCLALFVMLPAAVGYMLVCVPTAHVVAAGKMADHGTPSMIAADLAALALGMVGQGVFLVATQAAYSRGDTLSPVRAMGEQALICLLGNALVVLLAEGRMIATLACGAYALGSLAGGLRLSWRVGRTHPHALRLGPTLLRCGAGVALMAPPAWLLAGTELLPGRAGSVLALLLAAGTGGAVFLLSQRLLRSPELGWLLEALGRGPKPAAVGSET